MSWPAYTAIAGLLLAWLLAGSLRALALALTVIVAAGVTSFIAVSLWLARHPEWTGTASPTLDAMP